jgi:hypothetical protein
MSDVWTEFVTYLGADEWLEDEMLEAEWNGKVEALLKSLCEEWDSDGNLGNLGNLSV